MHSITCTPPVICTSATRPAQPNLGRRIYEADTKRHLSWQVGGWWDMVANDYD